MGANTSEPHKFLVEGEWLTSGQVLKVCFPCDNSAVEEVYLATDEDLVDKSFHVAI